MSQDKPKLGLHNWPGIPKEAVEILRAQGTQRKFQKNQMVVAIGDEFENLFLIEEGRFSFSIMNKHGDLSIYGYKGAGSTWGLTAAVLGEPAKFFFEATEESVATCVHRNTIWSLIDSDPIVRRGVIMALGWDVRQSIAVAHAFATLPLKRRLANFLVENANENGTIELSQAIIARNLGVSRYALGTNLQKLKHQSLIKIEYGRVRVLDPVELAKLGAPA